MKNRIVTAALAAAALSLGFAPASAATTGPESDGHEVRVVNNHLGTIRVFVQDAHGELHSLGRVGRGQYKVLTVGPDITAMGPIRVKFLPADPTWTAGEDEGIRTQDLTFEAGQAMNAFLEADLTSSVIEIDLGLAD